MSTCKYTGSVEKWGTFEAEMSGRHEGNPFTDYTIQGTFKGKEETKTVEGYFRLTAFGSYENTLEAIERIKNL